MKTCFLKKGKDKAARGHHPWIFSGAIAKIDSCSPGELVRVFSDEKEFLAVGYCNPRSQIIIRLLSFTDREITPEFFREKICTALRLRKERVLGPDVTACRLINSEGDFLPGLVVDGYGGYLSVSILTAGMEQWRKEILRILQDETGAAGIYENPAEKEREMEGLAPGLGMVSGSIPPDGFSIIENGLRFKVNILSGQKSGYFLDQRENRALVRAVSRDKKVMDCFSYTGGFSAHAAAGGAESIISVDSSADALILAKENMAAYPACPHEAVRKDVFEYLRQPSLQADLIILDPPAFCKKKPQIEFAARGYKDINRLAMKILPKDGLLYTASCSSFISPDLFQKIIFAAAKDAGRDVQILKKTGHGADHPINIYHPEGEYLKGLLCRVV